MMKVDPKTKDILMILAAGSILGASLIFPVLPIIAKTVLQQIKEEKEIKQQKEWEKFNLWRLRQLIRRMQKSKYVEIVEKNKQSIVQITEKGRKRLLTYNLENMHIDESNWDGKWRLIIYDVANGKRANSESFRRALNKLRLLKLQKSVYLTPFNCQDEVEYLRLLFDVGNEVQMLIVGKLENESAYKRYFGI